jgi:hypothetical protein
MFLRAHFPGFCLVRGQQPTAQLCRNVLEMGRCVLICHTGTSLCSWILYRHLSIYAISIYLFPFFLTVYPYFVFRKYTGTSKFPFRTLVITKKYGISIVICCLNFIYSHVTSCLFYQISVESDIRKRKNDGYVFKRDFGWTTYGHVQNIARLQVLTAASMKITTFGDIAPCSLVEVDWRFRGAYCLAPMMEAVRTDMELCPRILSSSRV